MKMRPEYKRAVMYTKDVLKSTFWEAECLIYRAKRAGVDWDTIDWDQLQGADLSYGERVDKLEQMIGKTYTVREERELEKSYDL